MANKSNYKAQVVDASKELTGKEKVALKNFSDMVSLDDATKESDGGVYINVAWTAKVAVHNEKADNVDYIKYVYVDADGTMYISGSEPLYRQYTDIEEDMEDSEEEWGIKVLRKKSSNYKDKDFLTCAIV